MQFSLKDVPKKIEVSKKYVTKEKSRKTFYNELTCFHVFFLFFLLVCFLICTATSCSNWLSRRQLRLMSAHGTATALNRPKCGFDRLLF